MLATEFVKDRRTKAPAPQLRDAIVEAAFKRGLVLLPCGKNSIRYIPPLCITKDEIDGGIEVLDEALRAAR
jgi:4-aminobutyrate aminotransferase